MSYVNIKERNIYFNGEVDCDSIGKVQEAILEISEYDNAEELKYKTYERKVINLYINSPGGEVDSMFGLIDIILNSKTPIYTYNNGICASAGFKILLAGHKRFGRKHSKYLYHQLSSWCWDSFQSMKQKVSDLEITQNMIEDYVLSRTKFTREKLTEIRDKKIDYYFYSNEAKDLGCIDEII